MRQHEEYKIKAVTAPTTCFHLSPGHAAPFCSNRTAPWVNFMVDLLHYLHVSVHKIKQARWVIVSLWEFFFFA